MPPHHSTPARNRLSLGGRPAPLTAIPPATAQLAAETDFPKQNHGDKAYRRRARPPSSVSS